MNISPQIKQICRDYKITDYLRSKGIEPISRGKHIKYRCPLPDHKKDNTPSFYVTETPDGELYKCFGCNAGGGIISLVRLMESHKNNGAVIRKLAKIMHLNITYIADVSFLEPSSDFILEQFCEEDQSAIMLAEEAKEFIRTHENSEDSIHKMLMVYKQLDRLIEEGREKEIIDLNKKMKNAIEDYSS